MGDRLPMLHRFLSHETLSLGVGDAMQNIYDDAEFFAGYSQFPRSREGLAAAPEWPVMRSMLPTLAGARVLDLGCGFGAFARWARVSGADTVLGVDLSERMLAQAEAQTQDPRITYLRADVAALDLPAASFDLVYSSLALHYIEGYAALCAAVWRLLRPGGRFVFSVEHPLYTAPRHPGWQTDPQGEQVWPVNNYLAEGPRVTHWITPGVVKYHRALSTYVNGLLAQGFHLIGLHEWKPSPAEIAAHPDWAGEIHRPTFLLIGAQRS